MMRMGVGALAFAALDAFGQNGAAEIVQDDQLKVGTLTFSITSSMTYRVHFRKAMSKRKQ